MRWVRNLLATLAWMAALSGQCAAFAQIEGFELTLDASTQSMRGGLEAAIAPLAGLPSSDTLARRDADEAVQRITDYLNSEAYFDPVIKIDSATSDGIALSVSAGKAFVIGNIAIELKDDVPAANTLAAALTVQTGDPARPAAIRAEELRLARQLQERGFAFARVLERDAEGDRASGQIDLTLKFDAGTAVSLGEVIYPEGLRQPDRFLNRLVPFESGALYSPEALSELNDSLAETGLYRLASARLGPQGRASSDGTTVHDVVVTVEERAPHTLSIGGSYATSEGLGLTGEWTFRNAAQRGDTLITSAVVAPQARTVDAVWRLPHAAGRNRHLVLGASGGREETDGFDRNFFTLDTTLETRRDRRNRLRYGVSLEASRETPIGAAGAAQDLYDLMIASLSANIVRDRTDSLLDPSRGWRADLRVEPGVVFGDATANYVHGVAEASTYRAFGENNGFVGALRARLGTTSGAGAVDLPTSRRFYAGGGGSVRGYAFQEIGPKDAEGRPVGGRSIAEVSAEVRWRRQGRWSGAAFVDAGSVSTRDVPDFSGVKTGAGFGAIYNTPAGPLRADLAWPLESGAGLGDVKVYISLGQTF